MMHNTLVFSTEERATIRVAQDRRDKTLRLTLMQDDYMTTTLLTRKEAYKLMEELADFAGDPYEGDPTETKRWVNEK
jgi:hypothetical protein